MTRIQPDQQPNVDLSNVKLTPPVFETKEKFFASLPGLAPSLISRIGPVSIDLDKGQSATTTYDGISMPVSDAFERMREPVVGELSSGIKESGIPLFGAIDRDNVDPVISAIVRGVKKNLLEVAEGGIPVHLVDIGMGYGSTAAFQLAVVDAAVRKLQRTGSEIPPITLHLVDPRFDDSFRMLSESSEVFRFNDYNSSQTDPLPISDLSARYLPTTVPFGVFFRKQLESDPEIMDRLESAGVKIEFFRGTSDQFFASNSGISSEGRVATVVVDGEHSVSKSSDGVDQLQPLLDLINAMKLRAIVVADDYKPSPPCAGVMAAIGALANGSIDFESPAIKMLEQNLSREDVIALLQPALSKDAQELMSEYELELTENSRTATFKPKEA